MKLGLTISSNGSRFDLDENLIKEADKLGFHSLWTSESWGHDAVTPAAWALALTKNIKVGTGIIQMTTRTPTMVAMTAITLAHLSGDRFILGLGPSGPQVVEGWHGVAYGKPLKKTREYVQIVKDILRREEKTSFEGEYYNLPYNGDDASGLGKPLKLIEQPLRSNIPIYLAAIGPKNIELTAEIADGWLPFMYSPTLGDKFFNQFLEKGFEKSGDPNKKEKFNISAPVFAKVCNESERDAYLAPARNNYTLYVGGMGAKDKNFYFNLMCEYGYEEIATQIQELYLKGEKAEAESIFPDELIDDLTLVGSKERIKEKLEDWKKCNVTELSVAIPLDIETIKFIKSCL